MRKKICSLTSFRRALIFWGASPAMELMYNWYCKWQTLWSVAVNNKLHAIQPSLGRPGSRHNTRREDVVLARIRLGHTYLTHSFLLNRGDQPECVGCACPLTVQHVMIDCCKFAYIRSCFFDVRNMKDLFDSVTPSTILLHVRAVGLFSRCDLTSYLGLCTHLTITFFSSGLCLDS